MDIRMNLKTSRRSTRLRGNSSRHPHRPSLEQLESRLVLSTIVWNGAGDGSTFSQASNWIGGVAPGALDDAQITITSGVINLPAAGITLHSLTQSGGTLVLPTAGMLTTTTGLTMTNATFDDASTIVGGATLFNSTLDDDEPGNSAPGSILVEGTGCTVEGQVPVDQTITVQGNNGTGTATLTMVVGSDNLGKIVLQSASGSTFSSNLSVGESSTFSNYGTVTVDPSSSGSTLTGNFDNFGLLNIEGATLTLFGSGTSLVNLVAAQVDGWGTLNDSATSFINEGQLSLDNNAAGALQIKGNFTQTSSGTLFIKLAGTTAGTQYDQLNVTGTATLGGTFSVYVFDGFTPVNGNVFAVLNFASAIGAFSTYEGIDQPGDLVLTPEQYPTELTLTAVQSPVADLAVTVVATPASLLIGGTSTFTVSATDDGPAAAQGVTLTDTLPTNGTGYSITVNGGTYTVGGGVVTVTASTINVGNSLILTITNVPSATGNYVDSASVATTYSFDPNSSNNSGSATCTVVPTMSDLSVLFPDSPGQLVLGTDGPYIASLNNKGPNDAQGVVLTETLPTSFTINSITASMGSATMINNVVTLDLSTLTNGSGLTLTVIATPTVTGTFMVVATAAAATGDPDLSNNTKSVTTTVVGVPASILPFGGTTPGAAQVATDFAATPEALVQDKYGNPVPNIDVTFTAPSTGPDGLFDDDMNTETVATNAQGVAIVPSFLAGTVAGAYVVDATVSGVSSPAVFNLTNTPGPASMIVAGAGSPESAVVATTFAAAPQVFVEDQYGNTIAGATVTFTAPTTGADGTFAGGVSTATATTNAQGLATAPAFTAGTVAGSYVIASTVAGFSFTGSFNLTNSAGASAVVLTTAGSGQSAVVGHAFASPLMATAEDKYGNPVPNVSVTFTAPAGGPGGGFAGGLEVVTETTNAQGQATSPGFTANIAAGTYAIDATATGVTNPGAFILTNNADIASSLLPVAGSMQTATVGNAFAVAFQASVEDEYANLDPGVTVTFAAPSSGAGGTFAGGLTTVTAITNAQGIATAPIFTANTLAGAFVVTATVSEFVTSNFKLTNAAGAPMSVSAGVGSPQTAKVGAAFTTALQATVDDQYGNPVSGTTVTFAAPSSGAGGSFGGKATATATTNALGIATAPAFTAGTVAGAYVVAATVAGATGSGSFLLTNAAGAASIVVATGGTPQSAVVGNAFASPLLATVEDKYGNPIAGATVTFTAPATGLGGTFAGGQTTATATTNAAGVASAPAFTADDTTGSYLVVAASPGLASSASFSLTNASATAESVFATGGSPQTAVVGAAFAYPLQVTVEDQYGNLDPGVVVTFTAPSSGAGGSFGGKATATATTNAQGVATAPAFTASKVIGAYVVTATVSSTSSVASFSLTNTVGAASMIVVTAGSPQSALAGTTFATALQVSVEDQYGNPIAGATVTFTAPSTGAGGSFAGGKATATATTNTAGIAKAPGFTAGTIAGSYTVTATATGAATGASFSLTTDASTSTKLTIQPNPVPIGHLATITATVAALAPATGHPTGSVNFFDGSRLLGSAKLNASGQAIFTTSTLGVGVHAITATYLGDPVDLTSTSPVATLRVGGAATGDFDGDGKTDVAVYDQNTATFTIDFSGGGTKVVALGNPADKNIPITGDFDGDGKTDLAIYDQTLAEFFILESGGGTIAKLFGNPKDVNIPVAGDYDGDGKTDFAIYDQTASEFLILESGGGTIVQLFGNATQTNIPVAGDYDGDGKTDLAIYDQTVSVFIISPSGGGPGQYSLLGNATHKNVPIAADYDGDGKTDLAIYDQTAGILYAEESGGGLIAQAFGSPADVDIPLTGDFDGDGKTDIGVYDPALSEYFVVESGGGTIVMPIGTAKHKNTPV